MNEGNLLLKWVLWPVFFFSEKYWTMLEHRYKWQEWQICRSNIFKTLTYIAVMIV